MISKALLTKGFVALSTSSAIGTGALKFFSTKGITERVNEELRKRFKNRTNGQVLEIAGFKDASTDRNILKKSLELRLTSQKVTDELVGKLEKFCEEGMRVPFEGITEVYKTLATVCSRTILLESKVQRDNLVLSKDADISEKLNQITDKHRGRKFIGSLEQETVEELVKACKSFGSKDVFSYEVTKEELADYMTFCVEEKPSVIRFWTGVNAPSEIVDYWVKKEAEEKRAREEEQRLAALEEKRQEEEKLAEAQKQAELEKQQAAEREKKEKEQAALREQQEQQAREAKEKREAEQRKADASTAKQKLSSLGFKVDEKDTECANQLHKFKEANDLKGMVKVCYKKKKFSDRAKEWGLEVFESRTPLASLNIWWEYAKSNVGTLISDVNEDSDWSDVQVKVKNYCLSPATDKEINDQTDDADWKKYVSICTMEGSFYEGVGNSKAKKIRTRDFWSASALS